MPPSSSASSNALKQLHEPQIWLAWAPGVTEALPLEWLDEHERNRYARFTHPQAAARFLMGRTLLKRAVAQLESTEPASVRLAYSANGKPFLPGPGRPHFSLSHSGAWVAVVLADTAIGLDLEQAERPNKPWQRPHVFLHPQTAAEVQALPSSQQPQWFTRCWSCQEAAVKLLDTSIFNADARVVFEDETIGYASGQRLHFRSWQLEQVAGVPRLAAVNRSQTQSQTQGEQMLLSIASHNRLKCPRLVIWPGQLA